MKITVRKEVTEEIEVEFPAYRKKYPVYYKILNESKFIRVECGEHWESTVIHKSASPLTVGNVLAHTKFKPITEDEFNEALTNASRFIRQSLAVKNNY